jgi:peptidoglycan/xylan/chitin deacetylase (PgdA/CDA1 family)
MRVTLSFDNGPTPGITERVLDELKARDLKATFFVVGTRLLSAEGQALALRAKAEGHRIGNHTYSHTVPLGRCVSGEAAVNEIRMAEALIGDLAEPTPLFRPFGGGGNITPDLLHRAAAEYLILQGYTCVLWNSIPRDFNDPGGWVERGLAQCRAQDWTLTVLHDLPVGCADRLPEFLDRLAAEGAEFVQDFPPDCLPLRRGCAEADWSAIMRS